MPDELRDQDKWTVTDSDEYEEISTDEVDRIVAELEAIALTAESENIRYHLALAVQDILGLVYDDESDIADAA
jgi:hypothetical protein